MESGRHGKGPSAGLKQVHKANEGKHLEQNESGGPPCRLTLSCHLRRPDTSSQAEHPSAPSGLQLDRSRPRASQNRKPAPKVLSP